MKTLRFGKTGIEVPPVGVGTWGHSGAQEAGGQSVGWSGHDDEAAREALLAAWKGGLTHWDTADVYGAGRAERLIGGLWGQVRRADIFLASKVGWYQGDYSHAYHPKNIRRQADASLQNLATEWIDLYYFHRGHFGEHDEYLDDAIEVFHRLREEGKIRLIGLSDWSGEAILRHADRVRPDVLQPYRNVVDDEWKDSALAAWARENEVGVAFFSPLRHGLLLGRYEEPPHFGEGDHRRRIPDFQDPDRLAHFRRCRQRVEERFGAHPEPVLHALLGALLADTPNACALVGMRRPEHTRAALTIDEPLTPEDAAWVRALYRGEL